LFQFAINGINEDFLQYFTHHILSVPPEGGDLHLEDREIYNFGRGFSALHCRHAFRCAVLEKIFANWSLFGRYVPNLKPYAGCIFLKQQTNNGMYFFWSCPKAISVQSYRSYPHLYLCQRLKISKSIPRVNLFFFIDKKIN
jgi:hypothetical protein